MWGTLFWHLGERPLLYWDESRLAVNAAEMLRTHRWIITLYQGQPDLWNTKPPLMVWLQALSMHLFGYSVWAFRLPTALAAAGLTVLVVSFAKRWLGGPLAGLMAGVALLGSHGFVRYHVVRTGDYEALLVLFTTAQALAVFSWLQTRQPRYLLLFGAAIGLAVLTKSVAGLFLLPGLSLEIVRRGRLLSLLRQPTMWVATTLAIAPPTLWYGVREYTQPGYWQAVWQNELGGRMLGDLEQNVGSWYYYLAHFSGPTFLYWIYGVWLVIACLVLALQPGQHPTHHFLTLVTWAIIPFLALISLARTKLDWYDAPIYPLLALLLGSGLALLARHIADDNKLVSLSLSGLLLLFATGSLFIGLWRRVDDEKAWQYEPYGHFLQLPQATHGVGQHLTALHFGMSNDIENYDAPLEFYALAFRHEHLADTLDVRYNTTHLSVGRTVILCGAAARAEITKRYHTRILYAADSCLTLRIIGLRAIQQ